MANHVGNFEQGGSDMSNGSIFNIGSQQAGRDINQAGGDINQITKEINLLPNSSAKDVLKFIEDIRYEVSESDIDEKSKTKIGNHLEKAIIELKDQKPDKKSIADSMKQANTILQEARTASETLMNIGAKIGKVAMWLGPYAHSVGLI